MGPRGKKCGAPMFEPEVFGKQCTVLKKVLVTLLGLFGTAAVIQRLGNCALLPPLVTPLLLPLYSYSLHANVCMHYCFFRCYSAIVFLSSHRFECSKRKLTAMTFNDFIGCAKCLIKTWTSSSPGTALQEICAFRKSLLPCFILQKKH